MSIEHYNLPDVGEGLVEAEIVSWKVKPGDVIKVNDTVVEIETAKSLVELPSPFAGTIAELLVDEGVTVDVGTPIIAIETGSGGGSAPAAPASSSMHQAVADKVNESAGGDDEAPMETLVGYGPQESSGKRRPRKGRAAADSAGSPVAVTSQGAPAPAVAAASAAQVAGGASVAQASVAPVSASAVRALAKPPTRKLAKDLGVDLQQVPGTGEGGIVTRDDVTRFAESGGAAAGPGLTGVSALAGGGANVAPTTGFTGGETRIPIKGVRKMTAQAMVNSAFTAPHVTEFITVDVSETMELVDQLKADRAFKDVKVSPMLVVLKAMILAIHRNPEINASWDEAAQEIVVKHYVNLGVAAATPRGLVVPNIKNAEQYPLLELAQQFGDLVSTARAGKTQPADMAGGTISITNVGVFGVDSGTPILNPGEAAILALGAIRQMPWVVDGEIVPRWVTQLGLSFDHRLVDGDLGSRYLADVAAILEDPRKALVWG